MIKKIWTTDFFGDKLRKIRGVLTVRGFAQRHRLDPSEWNAYENGKKQPSLKKLAELCNILEVEPNFLLSDVESLTDIAQKEYGIPFAIPPTWDGRRRESFKRLVEMVVGADEKTLTRLERELEQMAKGLQRDKQQPRTRKRGAA